MSLCLEVNVLRVKHAVDLLDKYVVLAFFLAFILSILTVILVVRYASHQIKKDKLMKKMNRELPCREKEEEDLSSDSYEWSDSDVSADINIADFDISHNKEPSIAEELETNYLMDFKSSLSLESNIHYHQILAEVQSCDTIPSFIPNSCIISSLFPHTFFPDQPSYGIDFVQIFLYQIIESSNLRKTMILHLLSFVFNMLTEMHLISNEIAMQLLGRYEQEIEDSADKDSILSVSETIRQVGSRIAFNLGDNNECNIDIDTVEKLMHHIFSLHYNCLKISASDLSSMHGFICQYKDTKLNCIMDILSYCTLIKCRGLSLFKHTLDLAGDEKSRALISSSREKLTLALGQLVTKFETDVEVSIQRMLKYRSNAIGKLSSKHEKEIIALKYEIMEHKESKMELKTELFSKNLSVICKSHCEEDKKLNSELNSNECAQIKRLYNRFYKAVMSKMSELEEIMFSLLQESCGFSDDQILSVATKVQNDLKDVKHKNNSFRNNILQQASDISKKEVNVAAKIIDHVFKSASSEYHVTQNCMKTLLKEIPSIPDEISEKFIDSFRRKLSLVVYDVVMVVIKDAIKCICKLYSTEDGVDLMQVMHDLVKELTDDNVDNFSISVNTFKWLPPLEINISDTFIDEMLSKYKRIIVDVLNDKVKCFIDEELKPFGSVRVQQYLNKALLLNQLLGDATLFEEKCDEKEYVRVSKKKNYEKDSSSIGKFKCNEIYQIYESLLGMKTFKCEEELKLLENRKILNSLKKEKILGIEYCVTMLKNAFRVTEKNANSDYFSNLLVYEEDYMIRRLTNKIELKKANITAGHSKKGKIPPDKDTSTVMKNKLVPRNVISPQPSPELGSNKASLSSTRSKKSKRKYGKKKAPQN